MPAMTRMVGIGVSFSAARTLSITHLLPFAHSLACEFLYLCQEVTDCAFLPAPRAAERRHNEDQGVGWWKPAFSEEITHVD
jgi:hypothetical protein